MQILVARGVTLTDSQIEGVSFAAPESVVGSLILDNNEKVVRYPSEWLTTLSESSSIAYTTATTYARNLSYFIEFLGNRPENIGLTPDEMLLKVNRSILEDWILSEQKASKLDRSTIRNREACVRSFYDYLVNGEYNEALLERHPFPRRFLSAKPHVKQVVSASLGDLVALMSQAKYERERLLLQFMYDSGVRISEVERVCYGDIQKAIKFSNCEFISSKSDHPVCAGYAPIIIQGAKGRGNSIKERFAIVTAPTLKRIASYHASPLYKRYQVKYQERSNCPAFLNSEGNAYNARSISKLIERLSEKAKKKGAISKNVHAHLFRTQILVPIFLNEWLMYRRH